MEYGKEKLLVGQNLSSNLNLKEQSKEKEDRNFLSTNLIDSKSNTEHKKNNIQQDRIDRKEKNLYKNDKTNQVSLNNIGIFRSGLAMGLATPILLSISLKQQIFNFFLLTSLKDYFIGVLIPGHRFLGGMANPCFYDFIIKNNF